MHQIIKYFMSQGYAHGFLSLEENTFCYFVNEFGQKKMKKLLVGMIKV